MLRWFQGGYLITLDDTFCLASASSFRLAHEDFLGVQWNYRVMVTELILHIRFSMRWIIPEIWVAWGNYYPWFFKRLKLIVCYQRPNSSFSSIESIQTIHFQEIHQNYHNFASTLILPKNGSHDPCQTPSHQWNQRHSSRWGWQPTWQKLVETPNQFPLQLRLDWQLAWDFFLRSWKRGVFSTFILGMAIYLHHQYSWDLLPKIWSLKW